MNPEIKSPRAQSGSKDHVCKMLSLLVQIVSYSQDRLIARVATSHIHTKRTFSFLRERSHDNHMISVWQLCYTQQIQCITQLNLR